MKKLLAYFITFLIVSMPLCFATEINYSYDANGNLVQDEGYYYEYNGFNQLAKVRYGSAGGAIVEEYVYDANGNRILKIHYTGSANESTFYPDNNFVQVVNASSVTNTTYYYAGNILLGHKNSSGVYYYHPDHLGSTSLITDQNGNVVEETRYGPFGDVISGGNNRYLYTGKELDDLGLYYYGARYYKQNFYHFSQPDPIIQDVYDPQNLNRFAYVRNNPYRYVDPSGNTIEYFSYDTSILKEEDETSISTVTRNNQGNIISETQADSTAEKIMGTFLAIGLIGSALALVTGEITIATFLGIEGSATKGISALSKTSINTVKASELSKEVQRTIQLVKEGKMGSLGSHTFKNREKQLPVKSDSEYYTTHYLQNIGRKDPQRIITGKGGEVYYTSGHYESDSFSLVIE